jgi:ATP-dependent exoDNAse (exonuclease V) alpha subunit
MAIIFNEKQQQAIERINEFVSQDKENIFYLMGFAGTGKTFLLGTVIKNLLLTNKMDHIFICAPTHKALKVIESYVKSNLTEEEQINFLPKLSFMTIHKLLEFKPIIVAEDGSKVFKSTKESKFLKQMENKLIVIDECSMISKEMIIELKKYIELYPIKVICMGDRKQLPPVGETESLIFTNMPKNYHFHILLDQIMRTNSSDIKDVCTIIRNWNKEDSLYNMLMPLHNKKCINRTFKLYHKKANYLESTWFKNFIKKLDSGNIPIILTWRNVTSDGYNAMIRKYVHKSTNLNNYMKGDYVMFNNYYTSPEDGTSFYTSDMIKITNITTEEKILFDWTKMVVPDPKTIIDKALNIMLKKILKLKNNFRVDTFTVEKIHSDISFVAHNTAHLVQTIHRDDLSEYHDTLECIRGFIEFFFKKYKAEQLTSKLWDILHKKIIDPYAELNFGYSITIYKSQGSTFHTALVDMNDVIYIKNNEEIQKALYTAAGRASHELGFIL